MESIKLEEVIEFLAERTKVVDPEQAELAALPELSEEDIDYLMMKVVGVGAINLLFGESPTAVLWTMFIRGVELGREMEKRVMMHLPNKEDL